MNGFMIKLKIVHRIIFTFFSSSLLVCTYTLQLLATSDSTHAARIQTNIVHGEYISSTHDACEASKKKRKSFVYSIHAEHGAEFRVADFVFVAETHKERVCDC